MALDTRKSWVSKRILNPASTLKKLEMKKHHGTKIKSTLFGTNLEIDNTDKLKLNIQCHIIIFFLSRLGHSIKAYCAIPFYSSLTLVAK